MAPCSRGDRSSARSSASPAASALGAAAATFGLVAGGLLGGPLGHRLITRHRLSAKNAEELTVGVSYDQETKPKLDVNGVLTTLLVIAIAIAVSDELNDVLEKFGLTLPKFVTALFCGMVLSNTVPRLFPRLGWPTGSPPLALFADVALGLFLAMSLMTLNLAALAAVALPLLVVLAAQTLVAWLLIIARRVPPARRQLRRCGDLVWILRAGDGRDADGHRHHDRDDQEIRRIAPLVPGGARWSVRSSSISPTPSSSRPSSSCSGARRPSAQGRPNPFVFTQQCSRFLYAKRSLPLKMRYSRRRWSGIP